MFKEPILLRTVLSKKPNYNRVVLVHQFTSYLWLFDSYREIIPARGLKNAEWKAIMNAIMLLG